MDPDERDLNSIANWFTYHPPAGNQQVRYELLRAAAGQMAKLIVRFVPVGPDRTVALRKLRECIFTANAAIACDETGDATTRPLE